MIFNNQGKNATINYYIPTACTLYSVHCTVYTVNCTVTYYSK